MNGLRIREVLRKEFRQIFRDPRTKRIVFAAPVIQLLLFGYAATTDVRNAATWIVDQDRTAESRRLIDALTSSGYFRVVGRSERPGDLAQALDRGSALVGIEIPPGFAADVRAGRGRVQVLLDGSRSNTATVAQGYITRILHQTARELEPAPMVGGVDLRARVWYNPSLVSRVYNVPAVIGLILLLMSLLLTALAVVRERELGTLEQLMVSPLTPTELMVAKTLAPAAIALFDLLLITTVAVLWFDIPLRGNPLTLLLAAVIYILAGLGCGLLISTISRTQQEAFMGMFLLFLPAVVLSGFMYPVDTMPPFFQALTIANPVRMFLEIVRGVFIKGVGLAQLAPQFAILTGITAVLFAAATWRFRRTLA